MNIDNIKTIVFTTIDELNQDLSKDDQLEKSFDTRLLGGNSNLDSLGLVNLIIAVEQNIDDEFGVSISLADEKAMSQKHSPFRTIGSLIEHTQILLEEKLNDW